MDGSSPDRYAFADLMANPRIVIVGAGFVGLPTARQLKKRLPNADVFLIDKKDHFLFTPRLIDLLETPSDKYTPRIAPIAARQKFTFVQGEARNIDRTKRIVYVKTQDGAARELGYDALVLCQGAKTTYFKTPGAEAYALPLKVREDVDRIHARVQERFADAKDADPMRAKALLSFLVVGAGPSGIEALFSLKAYAERYADEHAPTLKQYLSFAVLQAAPQILPGFIPGVVNAAKDALSRHNIDIFEGDPVTNIEPDAVTTAVGRRIPYGVLLWCAGIEANCITMAPETLLDRAGCIVTDQYLHVSDMIFAAGDTVAFADRNVIIPKNAQTAMMMVETITTNVINTLEKKPLVAFHYTSKGNILTLGPNDGVLQLKSLSARSGLARTIRNALYNIRERQITGN